MTESVESEEMWRREAEAAISDIRKHVRSAAVCGEAAGGGGARCVCVELTTLEGRQYRVQLSSVGWQVLSARDDPAPHAAPPAYETLYALLNTISQKYRDSFGGELMNKLLDLAKKTEG